MCRRKGFTLIELVVAMAIFFILIYMAFAAFTYILAFSRYNQNREDLQQNMNIVLDQMTKELRQVYVDGTSYGVEYPTYSASENTIRDIKNISSPDEPLSSTQYLQFGSFDTDSSDDPDDPILRFYILDDSGTIHRISYTLGVPTDGNGYYPPHYLGIPRRYWPSKEYEPCEILYSNETWDATTSSWVGIKDQPVTEQDITNFTVIRPAWSDKVIQIVIEGMVKAPNDVGYEKVRYVSEITIRE